MILLAALLSCGPSAGDTDAEPVAVVVPLDDRRLARRISVDLRGELPTADEIEAAAAGHLDELIDAWMEDPRFEEHLADVFAEGWQLRLDELRVNAAEFGLDDTYAYTRAIGDEPARLIAHLVAADRPFTDIVRADTTMANATLAEIVPLEILGPASESGWSEARYLDGRPPNGVLATSGLWLRHHTTIFNYNRGRSAVIAQRMLCYDFLARPVAFSGDADADALEDTIKVDNGCIACHAALDPLASSLSGFWPHEDKDGRELVTYHPEREAYLEETTGVAPAYFGTPIEAPSQLGELVASDPRFRMCAVNQAVERLWGRSTAPEDLGLVGELADGLEADDMQYKALLRAILATDEYRAGGFTAAATDADRERVRTLRFMSPATLADVVEDLTGFRWTYEGWDELDSDETGYRFLLGGADGDVVQVSAYDPGLSRDLVIRRLAQAAGAHVAAHDLAAPREERLLIGTTADEVPAPGDEAFTAEIAALYRRLLARDPTGEELESSQALYEGVLAASDEQQAWASVVSVLMRHPEFWSY